jgi:hypothetical protein
MAGAISLLVNDNPKQNTLMLDSFTNPYIFEHPVFKNINQLKENSKEIIFDARYDLRPDLLSLDQYGTNFWYPVILAANDLGSILQFRANYLNNRCLIPSRDFISKIIEKRNEK